MNGKRRSMMPMELRRFVSSYWMPTKPAMLRYALALGIVAGTILLRLLLDPALGKTGFAVSLTGMLVAAWIGGVGPALICQTVILLSDAYWYAPPDKPGPMTLQGMVSLVAFYAVGGIVGLLSEARTKTQRRLLLQQEETLIEREKLRATFDCIGDGIVVADRVGRITLMNPMAEQMTGWKLQDCLGIPVGDVVVAHDEHSSQTLALPLNRVIHDGTAIHETIDWTLTRRDGGVIPVSFSASPILSRQQEITGVVLVINDQTEHRRIMEELRDANRRKDEFLATLAHELRNPLAPIAMGVELLKLAADDPATANEVIDTMERQTKHMVRLIDDLLDVSRITRGKVELRKTEVELSQAVHDAVEATRPLIEGARHDLYVSLPEQPITINADPNRLTQILSNLLNNAAKYTPSGGRVELRAERQGNQVSISICDNGIGIAPQQRDSIFDMFMQARNTMENGHKGLGIGLTLVKSLVEMHGGTITVSSEGVNQGSTFTIIMPEVVIDAVPSRPHPADGPVIARSGPGRVLIVDDNEDALKTLNMMVRRQGHETHTARDGAEAVEVAQQVRPDIILMDIGMPRMNGYDAAREIRRHPWGERIALVATTGWGQDEDRRRTRDVGFDHHLVKPVDKEKLDEVMRVLLHRSTTESRPLKTKRVVSSNAAQ